MALNLGNVPASSTLYIPFETVQANNAGITISGLAVTDIEVYKNGSTTQRASDNGYALLDTDGIDFDGVTGLHGISINLSDNSDAGFYAAGSFYWVLINAITLAGVSITPLIATFRIVSAEVTSGRPVVEAGSLSDTGVNERFARIQSDVDTGLRVHIDDLDTGLHAHISDVDTGLHAILALQDTGAIATAVWAGDTGLRDHIVNMDTGLTNRLNIIGFDVDTGLRAQISDVDTGLHAIIAAGVTATNVTGFSDTGVNDRLGRIGFDVDTGLRAQISDLDTGLHAHVSDVDTGLHAVIAAGVASTISDTGTLDAIAWAILNKQAVDGRKVVEALRLLASILGGQVSGAGTGTEIFSGTSSSSPRVTATVDSSGNRTALVYALDT